MNLNIQDWKEFKLGALFEIKKGKRLTAADQEEGYNNYIGAIDSNNGVANHIGQSPIHKGNTISLSYNGSVGEAFYQKDSYWATDDVNALYSNYEGFNEYIGLFICAVIRQEQYKFSYGRKWTLDNMRTSIVKLPVQKRNDGTSYNDPTNKYSDKGLVPDWSFMELYIRSLHHKPLTTKNQNVQLDSNNISQWSEFRFGDLVSDIHKAKAINKDDLTECSDKSGSIRYITRTANNNGCEMRALLSDVNNDWIEEGNAITIGDTTATCFFQSERFITGDHMVVIRADWLNKFNALFIVGILTNEQYKYSYGRAFLMERIKDTIVKLPSVDVDGVSYPDWCYMEKFIKDLPYGDRLEC